VSGRGNVTRRGRNSWRVKFDLGADPVTGRRLTRFVTVRGTKRQAQAELTKLLSSADTGAYVDPHRETVAEFAARWLRDWAAGNISNKTYSRYEELLRVHVVPRIGVIPIQKLRAADLQGLYAGLTVADRTRLHIHRVIHRMLRHAAQWSVVHHNVAALVDAPSVKSTEIEILTAAEIARVLEALKGRSLYPIVMTALGTGMRRGELLALRWKDVDLDGDAKLRVEQSLEQTQRGGLVFKAPKTRHGRRTITLPSSTVAVLREHWKATLERRLVLRQGNLRRRARVRDLGRQYPFAKCANQGVASRGSCRQAQGDVPLTATHPCVELDRRRYRRAQHLASPRSRLAGDHARGVWPFVQAG